MLRIPNVTTGTEDCLARIRIACEYGTSPRELVLAAVPEVEFRIDAMIRDAALNSNMKKCRIGEFFIEEKLSSYFQTWAARESFLTGVFDCNLSGITIGQNFKLLVEIRNSLVHGNGSLTALQTKSLQSLIKIRGNLEKVFDLQVDGTRLMLDSLDRRKVSDVACEYLIFIDQSIAEYHLNDEK